MVISEASNDQLDWLMYYVFIEMDYFMLQTLSHTLIFCSKSHDFHLFFDDVSSNVLFLKKWFLRNEISQRMARQIKTNFINEWRGEAESWVYEICFDLPSHELWYFISQKPLFQKFHFNFLYKELDSWNVFISCTSPWYIISQNHFSKSFLKIFAKNLC